MFYCNKLIITFIMRFCTVVFPMTLEQHQAIISLSPAPAPAPALSPAPAPAPALPDKEVEALNVLLDMSKFSVGVSHPIFLKNDCYSSKFPIRCNCRMKNASVCRVTEIDLSNDAIYGHIPSSIGDFEYLTQLDLSSNKIGGQIPSSLGNLKNLSVLDLSNNYLDGPIPSFLTNLTSLKVLYLNKNLFNQSIPPELGSFPSLMYLRIDGNLLTGTIPFELGNLSTLVALYLFDNNLSGELPPQLGNLRNLQYLFVMNNKFTGQLPSTFSNLEDLKVLNVRGNILNGAIPNFINSWQDIQYLSLSGNNFTGLLPPAISSLTNLTFLSISGLAGDAKDAYDFPNLENAKSLSSLTLRNCLLAGEIPEYIWHLPNLEYLDLSFNNLSGGIPAAVKNSPLRKIFLKRNKLNSTLPKWILDMKRGGYFVDVSENCFNVTNYTVSKAIEKEPKINLFACSNVTDVDPKWLQSDYYCDNSGLRYDRLYINCGGNATRINGSDYEADLYEGGGSTFFLSENKAWGYSSMGVYLGVTKNKFILNTSCVSTADVPLYLNARVSPISLKYFGFCLKNDEYTVKLHFAEIGWLQNRANYSTSTTSGGRVFNVEIQGERRLTDFNIEVEAHGLGKDVTREFNVTINDTRLEIHLYWAGKGTAEYHYGPLISAISVSPVPKPHKKKFTPLVMAAIVGGPLLASMLILAICWKLGWIGKKPNDGVELFPGVIYTYKQIKAATNNFSPENKIGDGGFGTVYKGVLPPKGTPVAVKQLSNISKQGAQEFITEIGVTYALQHPNLVRTLGCCAEKNQLLLLYEYMENLSLDQVLFSNYVLPWAKRVKICIDVAKGLSFLHHDCKLHIIHGDIKSTNILLDKEFNAKISDFGFARTSRRDSSNTNAQPKEMEPTHTDTKIQGTRGYIAPECMKAIFTFKRDVYSYGIVVLEIVSGNKCLTSRSKGPTEYLLDKATKYWKDNNLIALVDPRLKYNKKKAMNLLNLAMACVSHDPMDRPTMSKVVEILEGNNDFKINPPVAVVSKSETAFSDTTESGNTSQDIISETMASSSFSKDINEFGISPT